MFEYIFRCYKTDICNQSFIDALKRMTWIDRVIFIGIIVLTLVGTGLTLSQNGWGLVIMFFVFISPPMITAYMNKYMLKNRHSKLDEYLQQKIAPLVKLLKGESYNLYNKKSLEWLIARCDELTEENSKSPFYSTMQSIMQSILPVITLILGALLAKMERQEILVATMVVIMIVLCLFIYTSVKDTFLGEDKRLAKELKTDLQYISTLLLK